MTDAPTPTPADADLVLKLYELRREEVMRASRSTVLQWLPKSAEECVAITRWDHPDNCLPPGILVPVALSSRPAPSIPSCWPRAVVKVSSCSPR